MSSHTLHLPKAERQASTVQTVIQMAAEQNPEEITTSAIAKKMGLSQGALFRHFPSKEAILQAVMAWVADKLLQRVDEASRGKAPLDALESVFLAHVHFVLAHPGVPRMLLGELQRSKATPAKQMARTLMASYSQKIRVLIRQGVAVGELRVDVHEKVAATMFLGVIQGLVMQSLLADNNKDIEPQAIEVFKIYKRGIEA